MFVVEVKVLKVFATILQLVVDMMGSEMRVLHALLFFLLLLSGDVESNPGPPKKGKMFDTLAAL